MCVSVGLTVCQLFPGSMPSQRVTPLPGWVLGLGFPELTEFCASPNFSAPGGRSAAVFVPIFRYGLFVEFRLCSLVSFGRWISIWLARSRSIGGVFSAVFDHGVASCVARKPPPLGMRSLFSGFVGVGVACFSSLN